MSNSLEAGARSAKAMSLASLSAITLEVIREKGMTTSSEVSDLVFQQLKDDSSDVSNCKTIKRRIYDILNVFLAAGFYSKDSKSLVFHPERAPEESVTEARYSIANAQAAIEEKERRLAEKLKLLASTVLLLQRNRHLQRPFDAIQLPAIFISYDKSHSGSWSRTLNGSKLTVNSESSPVFISPSEVVAGIRFPQSEMVTAIRQYPGLSSTEPLLVRNLALSSKRQSDNI